LAGTAVPRGRHPGPPLRVLAPPEITLIEIEAADVGWRSREARWSQVDAPLSDNEENK